MHDLDLSQRLQFAESDFLTALENGTLASYHQTWSAVPHVLHTVTASKTGSASNDAFTLVNFVASRISNLATCFLDIQREEELSTSQLQSDCDAMFRQMDALDLNTQPKSLHSDSMSYTRKPLSTPSLNAETSSPPFLTSAYRWLLDNLHNPYPTAEIKGRIAATSSCQVASVSSWFINARRRIGWNTLCREHFSNCRADMIDAAYRALVKEDPQRVLSPEIRYGFVSMKVAAEGLYSSTFARSAFAGDLDSIVKDMTEEHQKSVEIERCHQVEHTNLRNKTVRDSYPSPDRSIAASPSPALDDSVTDESAEEEVAPPIIAGSKRRRSSTEPVDLSSSVARRPMKRLRASMPSPTYLPSPPSSINGIDIPSDDISPEPSSVRSISETKEVQLSRKRCLPDADSAGSPKRQCNSIITPLHTVSDPLPRFNMENEYSIDDWFHTDLDDLFAIPPPVDATAPNSSLSWNVELFKDYSIPGNPNAPQLPLAQATDSHTSAVTDFSDLDSLLQSIGDTFPTLVPPSDITGAPYTTSLDSLIPDMSQTDIDWISLLNGTDTYQSTIHSTFPEYPIDTQPLPDIDLSMLQFPPVIPPVDSQGDFASKQAKLHQLHAMQEAVRRMEQELQSEGVII